jgi:hypothetical protein
MALIIGGVLRARLAIVRHLGGRFDRNISVIYLTHISAKRTKFPTNTVARDRIADTIICHFCHNTAANRMVNACPTSCEQSRQGAFQRRIDMKHVLLATAMTLATVNLAMTGTALAGQCPNSMAAIDEALAANPQISAEQTAQVMKLRGEGEAMHAGGQHAEAVATLAKAKAILGLK